MMACEHVTDLGAYVLGAVGRAEEQAIQRHLPRCRTCRRELARLMPLTGLLNTVSVEDIYLLARSDRQARSVEELDGPDGGSTALD